MPHTAQYKTMGGRTSIDEILDLDDSADQQRQVHGKYIRSHQKRPEGLYSPGMQQGGPPNVSQQMMAQEMVSSLHPAHPQHPHAMQQGMQQGMQKGVQQGEALVLVRQLKIKFGELPEERRLQIESADTQTLLEWSERVLTAKSLEEVLH